MSRLPPRPLAFALLLGLVAVSARPSVADPPPAPLAPPAAPAPECLTIDRVFGGKPIHGALPGWSWRPGHAELVRIARREKEEVVLALDPVTGVERTLLDLRALEALVGEEGRGEGGIGRGGAPRLAWAPDGNGVAVLSEGERIWAELGSERRLRLTHGGPPRSDVQVAPDGASVLFAAPDHVGPDLALTDLWTVSTTGGKPPQALPLLLRATGAGAGDVLVGALDWLYPEELGLEHAAWWSPDSRRVAFLRLDERGVPRHRVADSLDLAGAGETMWYPRPGERNPAASVGVVDLGGDAWRPARERLDLGTPAPEYVVRVAWTPDSARVLVVTLDRSQRHLTLRSCDPVTGTGTTLLEERDAAWIDPPPAPRFAGPRHLLWKSAQAGWVLQRLNDDATATLGGSVRLTPEGFLAGDLLRVVLGPQPLPEGGAPADVLVEGGFPGSRRPTVWRFAAGRPGAPWLSDVEGSVGATLDDGGTLALVRRSTALVPPVLEVRRVADGALVRTLGDARTAAYDALALPEVEDGATPTDGGSILWRLWKPRALEPGKRYPVIVTVYGGPGSRTIEDEFGRGPYWPALLVERGFLVLQADGRGTGGQGGAFERRVQGRLGVHELEDQVLAVKALAERPYVDASRVGMFGWSFGGTMVVNALLRAPDTFRAGVAVAPVTDWRLYDTIYTERYMGLPSENKDGYEATSAIAAARGLRGSLLLLHGLADDNVHPQNTLRLVEALLAEKKTGFDWCLYANRAHGLGGAGCDVFGRVLGWFERGLAPAVPAGRAPPGPSK